MALPPLTFDFRGLGLFLERNFQFILCVRNKELLIVCRNFFREKRVDFSKHTRNLAQFNYIIEIL